MPCVRGQGLKRLKCNIVQPRQSEYVDDFVPGSLAAAAKAFAQTLRQQGALEELMNARPTAMREMPAERVDAANGHQARLFQHHMVYP